MVKSKTIETWTLTVTPLTVNNYDGKKLFKMRNPTYNSSFEKEVMAMTTYDNMISTKTVIDKKDLDFDKDYLQFELDYSVEKDGDETVFNVVKKEYVEM